ncbi:thiamine pyrophosphate-dependent enzyme [Shigella flexneri]
MATASENQLDVKIILMNDEALGLVHQQQNLFSARHFCRRLSGKNRLLCRLPPGFGLETCDLNNEANPQAALQEIVDRRWPSADPCAH